jgi:hypothetical protein
LVLKVGAMHRYAVRPKETPAPASVSRARATAGPRAPIEGWHRFVGNQALQRPCNAATISNHGLAIQLHTEAWPRNATQGRDMEQAMARLAGPPTRHAEFEDRGEGVTSIEAGGLLPAPVAMQEPEETACPVQAKAAPGEVGARPAIRPEAVARALPNGSPVVGPLRNSMEGFFGTDFGDVQFHTGPRVQALAGSLGAQAFTIGNHVAFAAGRYQPHTTEGQRLIAHELTHVVQQRQGISGVLLAEGIGRPGDGYERQADDMAERYTRGGPAARAYAGAKRNGAGAALQLFSGSAAASYARTWALTTNSTYGRFSNDCTNFVSQSMDAGGWTHLTGSDICDDRKSDSVWWFRSGGCEYTACPWSWCPTLKSINASYTWGGAHNFYNFVRSSGRGTAAGHVMDLSEGDVLQMDFSGSGHIGHTMVVTSKTAGNLFLSYHTSDHLNEPFYPDGTNTGIFARNPDPPTKYYAWKM